MTHRSPGTRITATAPLRIVIVALAVVISLPGGLASATSDSASGSEAKNVILLIGDGMGSEHITTARWEKAGYDPGVYPSTSLAMDGLDYSGTVSTSAADTPVTDSAAAVTALMTGVKTDRGVIGQDATTVTGVSDGVCLSTIAELAEASGRATGAVSNTRLTHATPAGVYAHVNDRNNELLIASQFLESDLDVALSGGYRYFIDQTATDPWGASGFRTDSPNLVAEAQAEGYTVVTTASGLGAVPTTAGTTVLGLFASSMMEFESERAGSGQPSLAAMTGTALAVLAEDDAGFFLMVEGGHIDTTSHANNYPVMTGEMLAFDEAVETALTFADQHPDTLLIVTADHECGGLTLQENANGSVSGFFTTTEHTAADVPILASGPGADRFDDTRAPNTQVFEVMRDTMDLSTVTPTPTPGVVTVPDGDGLYDDVNGDGQKDVADATLYFDELSWILANEPVAAFDYNDNGRVELADAVWLFHNL